MAFEENMPIWSSRASLIEGLSMIKDAALLMIIAALLISFTKFNVLPLAFAPHNIRDPLTAFSSITTIILILVGAVIALLGVLEKLVPGASSLASYSNRYSTAASLIKTGYLGGLIAIIFGIFTLFILVGIVLLLVGLILLFIGKIGLIILMFSLNDEFQESKILLAGILFILGIFVSILDIIAWILVYLGASELIERIRSTRIWKREIPPPYPPL